MTVKARMNKINQVANDVKTRLVYRKDDYKSVWYVGSIRTGKPYNVDMEWSKDADGVCKLDVKLFTYDHKEAVNNGPDNHPSSENTSPVCYMILGAVKKMAAEKGKIISFAESKENAVKLLNFGGKLIKIVKSNGTTQWATVRDKPKAKKSFNVRVNLMRGIIEEGID